HPSMIPCSSSGSTRADKEVNPATSAKRTVTCLRSPSTAPRLVRIFSTRWRGVYDPGEGEAGLAATGPATDAPHASQKRAPSGSSAPQPAHARASGDPQAAQNLACVRFSWLQEAQRMESGYRLQATGKDVMDPSQ